METRKTKLALTASALAFALMLAGCGGGGSSSSAVTPSGGGGTPPQQEPEEQTGPVAVMMDMMLPAGLMPDDVDLPNSNDTVTVDIDKGETVTLGANEDGQGGVEFMCDSAYACSLTLTNKAGTLVAEYSTKKEDADADNPMVTAMVIEIPEPTPEPMEVAGSISLTDEAKTWLLTNVGGDRLDTNGEEIEINLASGETKMYGSDAVGGTVSITCDSAYPCTVTLRNVLGELEATMVTMQDADADAPTVMAAFTPPPPDPVDTFARLNDGNATTVHGLVASALTAPTTATATDVTGMGLGGVGVLNADMLGLRGNLDPNSPVPGGSVGATGAANGLTGGSMLSGATDTINASSDMAPAPNGWNLHALFRDWGDTAGEGDGGFETGAIVVQNLGSATTHPWNGKLPDKFANGGGQYTLTVDTDDTAGNDSVAFAVDADTDAPPMSIIDAGAAASAVLETQVGSGTDAALRRVVGTYRGVKGSYTCGDAACEISRDKGSDGFTLGDGNWQFRPDPNSMVVVPDQDWMVYGAWMTTPDSSGGVHRIGTFFNGFDPYTNADTVFVAGDGGLKGSAEYTGGAAGVYVDGMASGLFTATATLTANFDVNSNGTDDANDNDYSISGRIDDFRDTAGRYLGDDTEAMPNDPDAGGENDWVVLLGRVDLSGTGTIPATGTTGSADGVLWTGNWDGSFFGPNTDAEGDAIAPSGVAGRFNAMAPDTNTTALGHQGPNVAVTGAFGATKTEE